MSYSRMSLIFPLMLLLFLGGCSTNLPYRSDFDECKQTAKTSCSSSAIIHHESKQMDEYYLGFVEFDDQGQVRERNQMQNVLNKFYDMASQEEVLLITFVHGWHHNAAPDDNNVKSFQKLLGQISRVESQSSQLSSRPARKILGLYIGWRGESIEIPYVNDLTFWERKNTAENVGLMGVTEVLLKLEEIVNVKAGMGEKPKPVNSRMVVIGHSFGGAVVFTALQQVLNDRFMNSQPGKTFSSDAKGFGDLVVLVNPAFEAMHYATLYDISQQYCRNYTPSQLPKLAILTSETDLATKWAFPAGRFFSTLFETHSTLARHYCKNNKAVAMEIQEGQADRTAVGHFKPYQTHYLDAISNTKATQFSQLETIWSGQKAGNSLDFEGSRLTHLNRTHPLNPYLNIKVSSELISNHNDIWGEEVVNFLRDLIVISTPLIEIEDATNQK